MENSNKSNNFLSVWIALIPLFKPYLFFGINADIFIICITCVIFYSFYIFNGGIKIDKQLSLFFAFSLYAIAVPPLFATFVYGYQYSLSFVSLVIFLLLNLIQNKVDFKQLFKAYCIIVYICCLFFFFQELTYHVFGTRISGLIPFLENVYSRSLEVSSSDFIEIQVEAERSASFFLEPAHFVQYIAPCLMIMLFKKEYFSLFGVVLITSAMIFSLSGNGVLLLGITYFLFIVKSNMKKWTKLIFFFFILVVAFAFLGTEEGIKLLERTSELSTTDMERHSGFIRVYRGYFLWNELDPLAKIIGIGGNIGNLFDLSKFSWMMSSVNDRFLNGMQQVLITDGIIGLVLFLLFLRKISKVDNVSFCGKAIIISFVALMLLESIFNTSFMVLYISFVLCLNKKAKIEYSLS